jgi:hypothetical protein
MLWSIWIKNFQRSDPSFTLFYTTIIMLSSHILIIYDFKCFINNNLAHFWIIFNTKLRCCWTTVQPSNSVSDVHSPHYNITYTTARTKKGREGSSFEACGTSTSKYRTRSEIVKLNMAGTQNLCQFRYDLHVQKFSGTEYTKHVKHY